MEKVEELFPGVYEQGGGLYTENAAPGETVYGEDTLAVDGTEYRSWNPARSKAAAAIVNGLSTFPMQNDSTVLYLGAAAGTTVSHFADIARNGFITAVEVSAEPMQKLVDVAEKRKNIAPVLANARTPETYGTFIPGNGVGVVYQDIAQRDQVDIFLRNLQFLNETGTGLLCVKARSITSQKSFSAIVADVTRELEEQVEIVETVDLNPFHKEHVLIVCRKK